MKEGDIVYFKSTYKEGESYEPTYHTNQANRPVNEYRFCPGDRYRIDEIRDNLYTNNRKTGTITNLEDGTSHFAHSEIWGRIATVDEWREIQLSKLI